MAARFIRTDTLTTSCNRQELYDLLANATVDGFTAPAAHNVVSQSEAPGVTISDIWFDQTNQLLKIPVTEVDGSACSMWLSIGPDSWWYPGFNVSDVTIRRGEWVCFSYSSSGTYDITPMPPCPEYPSSRKVARGLKHLTCIMGPAQATIAPNEFGPICTNGFAVALYDCRTSFTVMGAQNKEDRWLIPSTGYTGCAQEIGQYNDIPNWPNLMGHVMAFPEVAVAASFAEQFLVPCFITLPWGNQDWRDK